MYPQIIQKLIEIFSKFPNIGPRTAARFVFYLLKLPQSEIDELSLLIKSLKERVSFCSLCFNPFGDAKEGKLCSICKDPIRDKTLLCVVEKESDLERLERTRIYNGLYFVLGGTVGTLRKKDIEKLRIKELKERIKDSSLKEVILATNPTTEGESTALYLERILKTLGVKITRLGRGLPIGGELEYADDETLRQSLEGRK